MIEVINREILIPREEYNIGTCYDDNTETRHFHLKRVTSGGVDLAALTFNLDIQYANGSTDAASLIKEVTDKDINFVLTINNSMLQVPGTVLIQIRALDEDGVCKWTSYMSAFFVEDHINTPGHYQRDLTQLEQYEAEWGKVRDNVNQLNSRMDQIARISDGSISTEVAEEVVDARVGTDNVVYDSLGAAIRKQFENAYEEMEDDTEDWTAAVAAEATARANADSTLQTNIDTEASTRASYDASLQNQINQIVAPTGEAPNPAEVTNARIGADGVTYNTLGEAIRNNDNTIKANLNANREALDNGYLLYPDYFVRGNITNNGSESNLSYRIKSTNKISFDKQTTYKIKNGFEVKKIIWDASTGTLQPSDTWYTDSIVFNTGNLYKLVIKRTTENTSEVADVTTFAQVAYRNNTDNLLFDEILPANSKAVGKALQFAPYGIEPFQTSFFKSSQNLFSNFCYFINRGYYGVNGPSTDTPRPMKIKPTPNWKGWLIKVKPNTTYTVGPCDFLITFFNIDLISDKIIQTSDLSDTSETTITSGETSHWMALTQRIERNMDDWMMVEGDTYPSEYVSGYPQWVNTPKSVTDKTIAFFGDSITAGSGWTGEPDSQGYHQYIHDLYGFTCLNYGYGGSGYITNYDGDGGLRGIGQPGRGVSNSSGAFTPNNVEVRLTEVTPSDLDGVVIFAGTNDWSHQVSIADFETALDRIFEYYQTNFGTVPLLIMTPIHRLGDEGTTSRPIPLINYVNSIIQKCREHGIPYIDTFTMSGLQPNNSGNSAVFFPRDDNSSHTIDGIHPNHLAHQRLARCIGETLNQMMLWNETAIR